MPDAWLCSITAAEGVFPLGNEAFQPQLALPFSRLKLRLINYPTEQGDRGFQATKADSSGFLILHSVL